MFKSHLMQSRRKFLLSTAAVGGSFAIGLHLPTGKARAQAATPETGERINIWVEIATDDTVTLKYARAEMGQGSLTSAPQLVADELDADWSQVRVAYVDVNEHIRMDNAWGDMLTVGSRTIRNSQDYLRTAGATARAMLVTAAAELWDVSPDEITVERGVVRHAGSGQESGFGALAVAAAALPTPTSVPLKDPSDWHIIGQPIPRVDIPASVDGSQVYGIDIELPGMVHAAMAQCPVFGGRVRSFDAETALARRGVMDVFTIDDGWAIVVVADNWWRAQQALQVVQVDWDEQGNGAVDNASILATFRDSLDGSEAAALPNNRGDTAQALSDAAQVVEAEYSTPFLSHNTMEPIGATLRISDERVDLWASTQGPLSDAQAVAAALEMDLENVYVHRVQAGGGFGRRGGTGDYCRAVALIAKELPVNTPVKLLWSREEDTQHGFYRPLALYRLQAGLDEAGNITAWESRIASGSILNQMHDVPLRDGVDGPATEGFTHLPYAVPNQQQDFRLTPTHVPLGFWRTVGWSQTPFAREQFIDELAVAAGEDAYHFRLRHMPEDELSRHILEKAAEAADWDTAPAEGVFRGIATTEPYGSYTAAVVEISVSDDGAITIHRIIQAINSGYMVNPDNIRAQLEGSAVWAISAAMWGEINIEKGRVKEGNFHDYRVMRLMEISPLELVLAPTGGFWGGIGEPGQAPLIPALCNALYAATGKRIRSLPLRQHGYRLA